MRVIPLSNAPNQEMTVTIDNVRWGLRLTTGRGCVSCDLDRAGLRILSGARVVAGEPIIPYAYLQTGNFIVVGPTEDLPNADDFNVSQFLVYLSAAEIEALDISPLTVGELDTFEPSYLIDDMGFYLTTDSGEILTDD